MKREWNGTLINVFKNGSRRESRITLCRSPRSGESGDHSWFGKEVRADFAFVIAMLEYLEMRKRGLTGLALMLRIIGQETDLIVSDIQMLDAVGLDAKKW